MKTLFKTTAFFALLLFFGCSDPCKDVICENGGTPTEMDKSCSCSCPDGFEGDRCETDIRENFTGAYKANETCDGFSGDYTASITLSASDENAIIIDGFGGWTCSTGESLLVKANVNGNDIIIEEQFFCNNGFTIKSGSGTLNDSKTVLTVTYSAVDNFSGTSGTCSGTYTKQ